MSVIVLAAKAAVAVLLLMAGGAKLADLAGFASTVRLFLPAPPKARTTQPQAGATQSKARTTQPKARTIQSRAGLPASARYAAVTIAAAELLAGALSLCWPSLAWVNAAVLALSCGVAIAAGLGFARHRGQPCHCFGALTSRGFGPASLSRALVIVVAAAVACVSVRPAPQLHLALGFHLLLFTGAVLIAAVAVAAAKALLAEPGSAGTAA
jgi:hypothetical protein